ncbi:MAG: hypothetical protein ACJ8C4_21205 [Gemmataceae bacterium]
MQSLPILFLIPVLLAADDPREYLTADTRLVVNIQVAQVLDASISKLDIGPARAAAEWINQAAKTLGLDPSKNFERIWIICGDAYPKGTLVVVQGKFDQDRLLTRFRELGRERKQSARVLYEDERTVLNIEILRAVQAIPGVPASVFVGPASAEMLLVAFEKNTLLDALTKRLPKPGPTGAPVTPLLEKLDRTAAVSVAAALPSGLTSAQAGLAGAKDLIGTIKLDERITARCTISMAPGQSASVLAERLTRGLKDTRELLPSMAQSTDRGLMAWLSAGLSATVVEIKNDTVEIKLEMRGITADDAAKQRR